MTGVGPRPGLGNRDGEDAVGEIRGDGIAGDRQAEPERSRERTLPALELLESLRAAGLARTLAANGQRAVVELDVDVLAPEAGELDRQHVAICLLAKIYWGHPTRRRPAEQALETLLHGQQVAHRIPRDRKRV